MLRRIEELPSVWRYAVLALLGIGLWFVLRWVDDEPDAAGPHVAIHVKLKQGGTFHDAGSVPIEAHTMFGVHADWRTRWWLFDVPSSRADEELAVLGADPGVEEAFVEPTASLPRGPSTDDGDSCPINTPSYEKHQGYLAPAPGGIDATFAWNYVRGAGVQFADIEGGWNAAHEDLPGNRIEHVSGTPIPDPSWRAHGTAVLGEVVGSDNGKGVIGIAPDLERVYTSSIGNNTVARAIDAAAERLHAGDVLLIELQGGGPRGRYVPMEYWDDNFDAIRAATDRGVVVIEAAGNGNEDLDHPVFKGKFERSFRDSGAILVGAGGPPRDGYNDREKLDFSNYGSRVDVQGWGRKVATLDYGDLQNCAGTERGYTDRHYTGEFSGTSSASPIVAGAAVLLESLAHAKGFTISPRDLRSILRETGTEQSGNTGKHIGPRPDLRRAIPELEHRAIARSYPM